MILILFFAVGANAEGINLDVLNEFASGQGFDIPEFLRSVLTGDKLPIPAPLGEIPGILKHGLLNSLSSLMMNLCLPILICVLLRMMFRKSDAQAMVDLLCALCCATVLIRTWTDGQRRVTGLIDVILGATQRLTPVLAAAASLTGGTFWSSAAVVLSDLCVQMLQRAIKHWGIGLCTAGAIIALCGAVAGEYALNRLFDLLKRLVHWLLGASILIYSALISAHSIVAAARDGAAIQTAKFILEGIVPIIGGGVSGAAGPLQVSAQLARSAVGITGVALIIRLCIKPLLALGSEMLALKLIAAAMEPLAEGSSSALIGHFGDILEMLLAIGIGTAVMAAMIPISLATLGSGL